MPTKSKKKPSVSKLKKKLDAIFSIYIRTKYADGNGEVTCYTCPRRGHYKEFHNGHFASRQYLKTRWDERNCRPQCYVCNIYHRGQPSLFAAKLIEEYGDGVIADLERDRMTPVKLEPYWYEAQIAHYKAEVEKQQAITSTLT